MATPRAMASTSTPAEGSNRDRVNDNEMEMWPQDQSPYHLSERTNAAATNRPDAQQNQDEMVSPANPLESYISQDWLDDAWLSQLLPTHNLGHDQSHPLNAQPTQTGMNTSFVHHHGTDAGGTIMMDPTAFTLDPRQVACAPIIDSRWDAAQMLDPGPSNTSDRKDHQGNPGAISSDPLYQQRSFEPFASSVDLSLMRSQRDPHPTTFGPSPIVRLAIDSLILPQIALFFKRIHPMIPVFSPSYVYEKIAIQTHHTDSDFCAMLLALTSLTLIHPLAPEERAGKDGRREHAKMLLAEACRLRDGWDFGTRSQFSAAMTSYFMFGALFELGQAEAARMRLREALSLGEIMKLHRKEGYDLNEPLEAQRRLKLFWVLTVTERHVKRTVAESGPPDMRLIETHLSTRRAYAMQRGGSIVFTGQIYDSIEMIHPEVTGLLQSTGSAPPRREALQHLARIFTFIDGDIVLCLNTQCGAECQRMTPRKTRQILSGLSGDAQQVFGMTETEITDSLTESQKVDLFITWQWLRNRIWRLAFMHGLIDTSVDGQDQLSVALPFQIAQMACMWCETFSRDAMDQHGRGFTEKICDIASLLPRLLSPATVDIIRRGMGGDVPDILRMIRRLCFVVRNHCRSDLATVDSILAELAAASQTLMA